MMGEAERAPLPRRQNTFFCYQTGFGIPAGVCVCVASRLLHESK